MSQTGYTPIQLYRSSTASAAPSAGSLADGELALNTTDEKLYFKNASGTVKLLASSAGASGTVTSVAATGGTGISVTGSPITSSGTLTITNTAPDQVVALTGAGTTTITGTYPNFTITSNDQYTGTVTSVAASGGTTGLTFSGSPITTSGTLTLGGTLAVANGGTGATSLTSGYLVKGNGTSAVTASLVYDDGTNVGIGTTSPGSFGRFAVVGSAGGAGILGLNTDATRADVQSYNVPLAINRQGNNTLLNEGGGNVGIGTSSPSARLHAVVGASPNAAQVVVGYLGGSENYYDANTQIFRTGAFAETMRINSAGNVTANVDIRAPIFYDSDNTGYYVNPNGTSLLNTVGVDSLLNLSSGAPLFISSASAAYQRVDGRNDGSDSRAHWYGVATSGATSNFRHAWYDGSAYFNVTASSGQIYFERSGGATVNASGDFRAPIFYDSNNTGYYLDPASTSSMNTIQGSQYSVGSTNPFDAIDASPWYGLGRSNVSGFSGGNTMVQLAGYYGLRLRTAAYNLDIQGSSGIPFSFNDYGQFAGSVRAPLFYDSNDTGFYVDPNSVSRLNTVQTTTITGVNSVAGTGIDMATNDNYVSMRVIRNTAGSPYNDGMFIGYGNSNGGLTRLFGGGATSGDFVKYSDHSFEPGSFRAPIFYDSNNTTYYVDPASGSTLAGQLNQYGYLNIAYGGSAYAGMGISNTYASASNFATSFIDFTNENNRQKASLFGNFGTDGSGYLQFLSTAPGVGRNTDSRTTTAYAYYNQWSFQTAAGIATNIIYDRDNTAYYVDPNSNSRMYVVLADGLQSYGNVTANGDLVVGNGQNQSYIYMQDADEGQRIIHCNSNRIGFLTQGGGWGSWCHDDGWWQSDSSVRAPIFYDSNNTAYYVDPANGGFSVIGGTSNRVSWYTGDSGLFIGNPEGNGNTLRLGAAYGLTGVYNGGNLYLMSDGGNSVVFNIANSDKGYMGAGGDLHAYGDMRAPIFYDRNNTAYYADPTGTSNFAGLTVANTISGYIFGCTFTQDSKDQDNITTRTDSGFYQSSTGTTAEGWPINDGGWQHMLSCTHSNDANYFAMQLGASFYSQGLFYRSTGGSGSTAWSRLAMYGNGYAAPLYANIYYDADNTSYYVDAASESALNTLTLFGELNLSAGTTYIDHTGTIYFRNQSGYATSATLTTGGNFTATGNVTAYSDARLKEDVETIGNALDLIGRMRGVTYTRKDTGSKGVGVIAQEMQEVIPQVVEESAEGTLSVAYGNLVGVLIEAVKELTARVAELEGK